jgi:hypothetical protein
MLTPADILDAARRRWPAVLRAEAAGVSLFPLRIPFGRPNTTADFANLRRDIEALAAARHPWRIDWEEIQTRKWGRQRWPMRVAFDSTDTLATALELSHQLEAFRAALRYARDHCPALDPWLLARAHRIVDHLDDWQGLVTVCVYFDKHPQPGCYARQVPVALGSKFIEEHAGILRELLDIVLAERVNPVGTTFEERYHLLVEPAQIRFRFLDPQLRTRNGWPVDDCSVLAPVFAGLTWDIRRVLVIENRNVFLCLPNVPHTLAIFGAGKAASLFPACQWMNTAEVVYWGDCDEAGYGILSSLRSHFAHVRSLLMDETAWLRWKHLAVPGKRDPTAQHTHLTNEERVAFEAVLEGPWMLEQERIPILDAEQALVSMLS